MSKARIMRFALSKKKNENILKRALNMREGAHGGQAGGGTYAKPDRFARARFLGGVEYRSRSAFKLLDLEQRFGLCVGKRRILDLGAAPGGWSQVAAEIAPQACVVAVDKKVIEPFAEARIQIVQCDLTSEEEASLLPERVETLLAGKAELVLCDLAPETVGLSRIDNTRFAVAVGGLFPVIEAVLEVGGDWVVKMRHSAEEGELWEWVKANFREARVVRSVASRRSANEVYWVARGFRK